MFTQPFSCSSDCLPLTSHFKGTILGFCDTDRPVIWHLVPQSCHRGQVKSSQILEIVAEKCLEKVILGVYTYTLTAVCKPNMLCLDSREGFRPRPIFYERALHGFIWRIKVERRSRALSWSQTATPNPSSPFTNYVSSAWEVNLHGLTSCFVNRLIHTMSSSYLWGEKNEDAQGTPVSARKEQAVGTLMNWRKGGVTGEVKVPLIKLSSKVTSLSCIHI